MPNFEEKKQIFYQLKELISAGVDYKEILKLFRIDKKEIDKLESTTFAKLFSKVMKLNKFDLFVLEVFDHAGRLETGLYILINHYKNLAEQSKNFISLMIKPLMLSILALLILPLPQVVSGKLNIIEYLAITYVPIFLGFLLYWFKLRRSILRGTLIEEIPFLKKMSIAENIYKNLYFSSLSNLLEAGINIKSALDMSNAFVKTKKLERIARSLKDNIGKQKLIEALMQSPLEADALQWIATYEKNGRLDIGFYKIAGLYEDKAISDLRILVKWVPKILYFIVVVSIAYNIINR
jgi:general secretion pathway protein F